MTNKSEFAAAEATGMAGRYAVALFELARDGGQLDAVAQDLAKIGRMLDASPEFPDMMETVSMARELDGFAAQCDAQLSINVLSDGAPWSANYVQAVASQDGLLLSRDKTLARKIEEVVAWQPGKEGGALEGTPASDERFAYIKYDR